jgi:hypothetical protein
LSVVKEFSMYQPPITWKAWEYTFAQGTVSPSGAGRKRITAYPFPEASTSGFQNLSSTFLLLDDFSSSFCRN